MYTVLDANGMIKEFRFITSINDIHKKIKDGDYLLMVQVEDTIELWTTEDKVRGCNDLVHYYEYFHGIIISERNILITVVSISN